MNELKQNYSKSEKEIKQRLKEFTSVKDDDVFYELCFCLLTPQSNAKKCDKAVRLLRDRDFFHKNLNPSGILKKYTRFHNNKAKYLLDLKKNFADIKFERDFLVKNIKGLGLKEASHFLRNIGYRNFAILDRHILKNLVKFGAIDEIPKFLTAKKYLEIERKFYDFSKKVKISMDELDLLFWSMETGEVFK